MKTKEVKTKKFWLPAFAIMVLFAFAACSNTTNATDPRNELPPTSIVTVPGTPINDEFDWAEFLETVINGEDGAIYTANIIGHILVEPTYRHKSTFGDKEVTVVLTGSGSLTMATKKANYHLLSVGKGQKLVINGKDLALIGITGTFLEYSSIIGVNGGAELELNAGTLTGNASICGGGVYVYDNATFTMNGGEISGNVASAFGGGVKLLAGNFIMNKGKITGNEAKANGGGVKIEVLAGKFTMNGGEISNNSTVNYGGGVFALGEFTMKGGVISGNSANYGGGVNVLSGTFRMVGGTVYGSDENSDLANKANIEGAALRLYGLDLQLGNFDVNGDWNMVEKLYLHTPISNTLRMVNGVKL